MISSVFGTRSEDRRIFFRYLCREVFELSCFYFRKCVCVRACVVLVIVLLHLMMCAGVFLYFNVLVTAFNTTDELIEV